jgi:hypothetical protein
MVIPSYASHLLPGLAVQKFASTVKARRSTSFFSFHVLFYSRVHMFWLRLLYSRRFIVNGRAVVPAGFRWLLTNGTRVQSLVSVCDSCDG